MRWGRRDTATIRGAPVAVMIDAFLRPFGLRPALPEPARISDTGVVRRISRLLAVLTLGLVMAACTPIYRNHGYIPSDEELAKVSIGSTREDVAATIGRPSASGLLNDVGWFYVQSRWETRGARAPQEIDRQVVSITFTEAGRVSNIERFGLEKGRVVALSRRVTESNIKGVGFIAQLLSNVGRMDASQLLGSNTN